MDADLRQHFDYVEKSFFAVMPSFLKSYSSSTEIINHSKRWDQIPVLQGYRTHKSSFELKITLLSNQFFKGLKFSYMQGAHSTGNKYHSTTLKIFRIDEESNIIPDPSRFDIYDYFTHKKMDVPVPFLFLEDDDAVALPKIRESIKQIETFLNFDEIRRILTSQEWIIVPSRIQRV